VSLLSRALTKPRVARLTWAGRPSSFQASISNQSTQQPNLHDFIIMKLCPPAHTAGSFQGQRVCRLAAAPFPRHVACCLGDTDTLTTHPTRPLATGDDQMLDAARQASCQLTTGQVPLAAWRDRPFPYQQTCTPCVPLSLANANGLLQTRSRIYLELSHVLLRPSRLLAHCEPITSSWAGGRAR
jgi:hypothetical protein